MSLHPLIVKILDAARQEPPVETIAIADARARMRTRCERLPPPRVKIEYARDVVLAGAGREIPGRVYVPAGGHDVPLILFFHGGGWALGDLDTHDNQCRRLCHDACSVVVAVDYRLAPEHVFPAAFEDCLSAVEAAATFAPGHRANPDRLVLAGDSAGGALAAAVALAMREAGRAPARAMVLFYPALQSPNAPTASMQEFAEGYGLTERSMKHFWSLYAPQGVNSRFAAPLLAEDLSGLPPTFVVTAQYDVLRDEGETFASRIKAAGGMSVSRRVSGVTHGFMALEGMLPLADSLFSEVGAWVQERCR